MKLIAIDPGTEKSAVVIWDGVTVKFPAIFENSYLLEWLRKFAPDHEIACEMIACYGMPVGAETFETCLLIGRIMEIWYSKGISVKLVYRRDVKMHLCGTMKAKDANIRQALIDRFGKPGTQKSPGPLYGVTSHIWSALAVGVAAFDKATSS